MLKWSRCPTLTSSALDEKTGGTGTSSGFVSSAGSTCAVGGV